MVLVPLRDVPHFKQKSAWREFCCWHLGHCMPGLPANRAGNDGTDVCGELSPAPHRWSRNVLPTPSVSFLSSVLPRVGSGRRVPRGKRHRGAASGVWILVLVADSDPTRLCRSGFLGVGGGVCSGIGGWSRPRLSALEGRSSGPSTTSPRKCSKGETFWGPTGSLHRVAKNPAAKGQDPHPSLHTARDAKQVTIPEPKKE